MQGLERERLQHQPLSKNYRYNNQTCNVQWLHIEHRYWCNTTGTIKSMEFSKNNATPEVINFLLNSFKILEPQVCFLASL